MKIHLHSIHGLFRGGALEIGRDSDNGGQTVYVMELAKALSCSPRVEQVTLFTRRIEDPETNDVYAQPVEAVNDKFDIRRIDCGGPGYLMKEGLWPHLDEFVSNTIRVIKAEGLRPDFMHSHYADSGYVAAELSAFLNTPFVHSAHSLGKNKLKRMIESGMPRAKAMERFQFARRFAAEELTLANAEFVITSTEREIELFSSYENAGLSVFHVLPPGVDFERFYPFYKDLLPNVEKPEEDKQAMFAVQQRIESFLNDPNKPLIVTVCRPDKTKNISGLIEAYGRDPELQAMANLAVFAGIRGDIDSMNPSQREVLTQILLLMDKFNLYGKLAIPKRHDVENEVPEIYRLAARQEGVFVNVSHAEQFGLTLLESSACGLPVVATQNGGPAEILPKCQNGLLVDPTDTAAIQSSIKQLLVDKEQWRRFSNNGATNAREHYGWDAHVNRYLDLMEENLTASGGVGLKQPPRVLPARTRLREARFMLACDVDGTMIDDDSKDQPHLNELIEFLSARGDSFVFAVATGRNLKLVAEVIEKFGIPVPDIVVSSVGAEIHYGLSPDLVDKTWQNHIDIDWDRDAIELAALRIPGLTLQEEAAQRRHKISLYRDGEATDAESIAEGLGELAHHVRVVISHSIYVDLLPRRASKGRAIRHLCQQWDIPLKQTVVCGDSGNDLDMMQTSALAVVVGNAEAALVDGLEHTQGICFAQEKLAGGILEGLRYFDFPAPAGRE
ncbi:MAG: sucrose-phosphate synthase [Verrucomicrobiales bacterium]|jgi:sucrose-phosphate synthase